MTLGAPPMAWAISSVPLDKALYRLPEATMGRFRREGDQRFAIGNYAVLGDSVANHLADRPPSEFRYAWTVIDANLAHILNFRGGVSNRFTNFL
jgi:hypothetical protein